LVVALSGCALIGVWAGLPWLGDIATAFSNLIPHVKAEGHVAERLQIWRGFLEMAQAGFPWGWGVESVSAAPLTPFFAGATSDVQAAVTYMHPHNVAIQIAVELGLPGLLLAFALSALALSAISRAHQANFAPLMALFAYAFFVAMVSHGLWQAWWWSAVFSAVALMHIVSCPSPSIVRSVQE
jgi:O-antigen ligase